MKKNPSQSKDTEPAYMPGYLTKLIRLPKSTAKLIDFITTLGVDYYSLNDPTKKLYPYLVNREKISIENTLCQIDYNRCRLPIISYAQLTDITQGVWELWREPIEENINTIDSSFIARNPKKDLKKSHIGIDFGTSSTIVAYEDDNGNPKLIRVGVDDFYEDVKPEHYENPTILEFLDFQAMIEEWTKVTQQPDVQWNMVRCSHEALYNLRNNGSNLKVIASMLTNLKQWALRGNNDTPITITDQIKNYTHELLPLTSSNPVKGSQLQVGKDDPFDPIELYAWFLGLNINWRNRGIFLQYYMTFPVSYPSSVKDNILASFRRGIMRSLPESLVHDSEIMESFTIEERGSEPSAYAASAMTAHNIEPTDKGIAYAVFDFGGGTTDFDFGIYRWANKEEELVGIEDVFEHYEAAGDNFLGGENLLENMAFLVFQNNLDICRQNKITFTKPLDAQAFYGSEPYINNSLSARTNTLIMMATLRDFWERRDEWDKVWGNSSGVKILNLLSIDNQKINCEFSIQTENIANYLEKRIQDGILSFYMAMHKAFQDKIPKEIHVLLAGNSSKSPLILDAFGFGKDKNNELTRKRYNQANAAFKEVFTTHKIKIIPHAPLHSLNNDESIPTAKTGVALGIIKLAPGSSTEVIKHSISDIQEEAPFSHYVGHSSWIGYTN